MAGWYGIPQEMIPEAGVSIGTEARTDERPNGLLGIPAGTPISYRAGDQPNNAFSLNVMEAAKSRNRRHEPAWYTASRTNAKPTRSRA